LSRYIGYSPRKHDSAGGVNACCYENCAKVGNAGALNRGSEEDNIPNYCEGGGGEDKWGAALGLLSEDGNNYCEDYSDSVGGHSQELGLYSGIA